jgi:hypothetical protein
MLSAGESFDIIRLGVEGIALIVGIAAGKYASLESRQRSAADWPSVVGDCPMGQDLPQGA